MFTGLVWRCRVNHDILCSQAQFDAGELITQREIVSGRINEELTNRAAQFGLVLDDISIVSFLFWPCFSCEIEYVIV